VLCNVRCVVALCCLLVGFHPTAQQPGGIHATHSKHHIQHRIDRRFVWFGCCAMLIVMLPWVGCLWGFARQRNNPEATCNTQHTHHIQHRIDMRFVWFGCCVMLVVLWPCVVCSWGFARQPSNSEATRNTQHTPHTTMHRQALCMVWVLCNFGCVVALVGLFVGWSSLGSPAARR
jgi:heme/copper-type cytochrome/quinol oxidase subunit 2